MRRASDSEFAGPDGKSERKRFGEIHDGIRIFEKRLIDFNLAPEIAAQLLACRTNFTYSGGKIVFFSGVPGDMVYSVLRGLVALYTPTEDGSRVLFRIAGPGDLLGYTNFLGEQRSRQVWEAHARDNCEIALITSGAYRAYFADGAARRSAPTLWTNQRRVVPANGQVGQVCRSQFSTPIELVIEELARRFGVSEP